MGKCKAELNEKHSEIRVFKVFLSRAYSTAGILKPGALRLLVFQVMCATFKNCRQAKAALQTAEVMLVPQLSRQEHHGQTDRQTELTACTGSYQHKAQLTAQSCFSFPQEGFNKILLLPSLAQCCRVHKNVIPLKLRPFFPVC